MAKIIVYGNQDKDTFPINNNIVFNNNTLFNINDVTVTTQLVPRNVIDYKDKYSVNMSTMTLDSMKIDTIDDAKTYTSFTNRIIMSFDRTNLSNYAHFGSLYEVMRSSISDIITKWRGSLYIEFFKNGNIYETANNFVYNKYSDTSKFTINAFLIKNTFELNYTNKKNIGGLYSDIKDLSTYYDKYEIWYIGDDGKENSFRIIGFTGSTDVQSGYISVIAKGNCFPSGGTIIKNYHIRPIESEYIKFYSELNTLQKYLLNRETTPKYNSTFKILSTDVDNNVVFENKELTWETSDGYNIDIDTIQYGNYLNSLLGIAISYDEYKSDLMVRFLTPASLTEFDNTGDNRMKKLLHIFGREFDEIKSFIDGIAYVSKVSYDKIENIPDILIKNLAQNLGWETFPIVDEEDMISSLFSFDKSKEIGFYNTPYEIDIELWRRIVINTNWFFKSKGTRKAIEAIFSFIGAPECLIDFNEHIYLADQKINIDTVNNAVISKYNPDGFTRLPYNNEGFPKAPNETPSFHFQISGNTDSGQHYIDLYRDLWNPIPITKTIDNRKSWRYITGVTNRFDDLTQTSYSENDSRLVINTKEVSITLDIAKAIECDVYNFNYEHNYPVSSNGRAFPYPSKDTNKINVTALTFTEYIQKVYTNFIDVKNRKVITDNRGGGYPTLTKLYTDYLNNSLNDTGFQSKRRTVKFMLDYISRFDKVWPKFVSQLIPATTIIESQGEKYRNTIFTPQKFVYRAGIDTGSEFAKKQKGVLTDNIQVLKLDTEVNVPSIGEINIYKSNAEYHYSPFSIFLNDNNFIAKTSTILNFGSNQKWNYNIFTFNQPNYYLSGSSKIETTSFTYDSVYYYDDELSKKIDFIFTNPSDIDNGSGNTKTYFTLNEYNYIYDYFNKDTIYDKQLTGYTYSGTSLVYTDSVLKNYLKRDTEYLVKLYFEKIYTGNTFNGNVNYYTSANTPYNLYENFDFVVYPNNYDKYFDPTKYPTYADNIAIINTKFNYDVNDNLPFRYYQEQKDYFFVSVGSPLTPVSLIENNVVQGVTSDVQFITENIPVVSGMTSFITTYNPIGDIQVAIRGLIRIPNEEYYQDTTFITNLRRKYILNVDPLIPPEDTLTISYITNGTGGNISYDCESYIVSSVTSASTRPVGEKFYYNSSTTKYEYYLNSGITTVNDVTMSLNGLTLANNLDFTLSNLDNTKIIFNISNILSGYSINACYITNTDISSEPIYELTTNPYDFSWNIGLPIPIDEIGYFYQEFTDINDTNFQSVLYSSTTNYINNQSLYTSTIDFNNTPLTLGVTYRYRIVSNRQFITISNNTINIKKYSNSLLIKLPS